MKEVVRVFLPWCVFVCDMSGDNIGQDWCISLDSDSVMLVKIVTHVIILSKISCLVGFWSGVGEHYTGINLNLDNVDKITTTAPMVLNRTNINASAKM